MTENYKNDIAWINTLRDSLRSRGYIALDACAHCNRKETIDHCFLNCSRAKGVWAVFIPTLSALLSVQFRATMKTVFSKMWPPAGTKHDRLARYLVKTILCGIWFFHNKATFHNGTKNSRAVVRYIRQHIKARLKVDFTRMSVQGIEIGFRYSGQPSTCYRCNSTDHEMKNCPKVRPRPGNLGNRGDTAHHNPPHPPAADPPSTVPEAMDTAAPTEATSTPELYTPAADFIYNTQMVTTLSPELKPFASQAKMRSPLGRIAAA